MRQVLGLVMQGLVTFEGGAVVLVTCEPVLDPATQTPVIDEATPPPPLVLSGHAASLAPY